MIAEAAAPRQPSLRARICGAYSAVLGGALWIIYGTLLLAFVTAEGDVFTKFDIRGGLPMPTRMVLDAGQFITTHRASCIVLLAAVCVGLARAAVASRSRWTVFFIGLFAPLSLLAFLFLAWSCIWSFLVVLCGGTHCVGSH
jgi:hypothetical protein